LIAWIYWSLASLDGAATNGISDHWFLDEVIADSIFGFVEEDRDFFRQHTRLPQPT
jgi:hypothetical protein